MPALDGVVICAACGAPIQRQHDGGLYEGMSAHYDTVHPGEDRLWFVPLRKPIC